MNKSEDLLKLYRISKYDSLPNDKEEQRAIVKLFYDHIRAPKGRVSVNNAIDGRIYHVATRLLQKAWKKADGLSALEKEILDAVLDVRKNKDYFEQYEKLRIRREGISNNTSEEAKFAAYVKQNEALCVRLEGIGNDIGEDVRLAAESIFNN
jgi:hypothetical protein